jgi:hypothetical protein
VISNAIYGYRRVSRRKSAFLACGFLLFDQQSLTVGLNDISQTGAGIATNAPLVLRSQVRLAVNTKKKGLIIIDGRVCWSKKTYNGWRSGISFDRKISFEPGMIA